MKKEFKNGKTKKIVLIVLLFVFMCYLYILFLPIRDITGIVSTLENLEIYTYESDGVTRKVIYKENPRYINDLNIYSAERKNYVPEIDVSTYDDAVIDEFYTELSQFKFKPYIVRNMFFNNKKTETYYNKSYIALRTTNSSKAKHFPFEFYLCVRIYGDYTNERYNVNAVDLEILLREERMLNNSLMYHLPKNQIEEFDELINSYIIDNKELFKNNKNEISPLLRKSKPETLYP